MTDGDTLYWSFFEKAGSVPVAGKGMFTEKLFLGNCYDIVKKHFNNFLKVCKIFVIPASYKGREVKT